MACVEKDVRADGLLPTPVENELALLLAVNVLTEILPGWKPCNCEQQDLPSWCFESLNALEDPRFQHMYSTLVRLGMYQSLYGSQSRYKRHKRKNQGVPIAPNVWVHSVLAYDVPPCKTRTYFHFCNGPVYTEKQA